MNVAVSRPSWVPNSAPVIVIGMHRSGTSVVTKVISELGVHIGAELDIHNEAICFKDTNRQLLYDQGAHWAKPEPFLAQLNASGSIEQNSRKALELLNQRASSYGKVVHGQAWGWKDPRNTLTLPIWLAIFPHAKVIHVVRNGIDVALSVSRRELKRYRQRRPSEKRMFPPTIGAGYRLWKEYLRIAFQHQASHPDWVTIKYEDLVSYPHAEIEKLSGLLDIRVSPAIKQRIAQDIIRQPSNKSLLDQIHIWLLLKSGLIDPTPLKAMDYV